MIPLPRIIAEDREALLPSVLPNIDRSSMLDAALTRRDRSANASGRRQALAIIGEGGLGKSVLLGQLLSRLESLEDEAVVLVSCAQVAPYLRGTPTHDEINKYLGEALGGAAMDRDGLMGVLHHLSATYSQVTLLIDTIDLILSAETLPGLGSIIGAALAHADVVLTCREREFVDYLRDARHNVPRLTGRLVEFHVPTLNRDEIIAWAEGYLLDSSLSGTADADAFVTSLQGGLENSPALRDVCSVPVRLSITCDVFSSAGWVPEDLTVTRLYETYWAQHVRHNRGGIQAALREQAALAVAKQIVSSAGQLAVLVPSGSIDEKHESGLHLLASEGVLRQAGTFWEFFHQTFGEFAYARWLLTQGPESEEFDLFAHLLRSGRSGLWQVARYVLLQAAEDSKSYEAISSKIPLLDPESAWIHVLAALRQLDSAPLLQTLNKVLADEALHGAVVPALGDAPAQHSDVSADALLRIAAAGGSNAVAACGAYGRLLARASARRAPGLLAAALTTYESLRDAMDKAQHASLSSLLLVPLAKRGMDDDALRTALHAYPTLAPDARAWIVRSMLTVRNAPELVSQALLVFTSLPAPPLSRSEGVQLIDLFWAPKATHGDRYPANWRELLTTQLPANWIDYQLQYLLAIALDDWDMAREVILAVLSDAAGGERLVNLFKLLAANRPHEICTALLQYGHPQSAAERLAYGSVADAASKLAVIDSEDRERLIDWLRPGRTVLARNVWAAQVILARDSIDLNRQILQDLNLSQPERPVVESALHAWVYYASPDVISQLRTELRALVGNLDVRSRLLRSRLEARLSVRDPLARRWLEEAVRSDPSVNVAGTAAKSICDEFRLMPVNQDFLFWLSGLIDSGHDRAVLFIARFLVDNDAVSDGSFAAFATRLAPLSITRLKVAIADNAEDQVVAGLLELAIRIDRSHPLNPMDVNGIFELISRRAITASDPQRPAAIRDLGHLVGTAVANRLDLLRVRDLVAGALTSLPPAAHPRVAVAASIASMLVGMGYRDTQATEWMYGLFERSCANPEVAQGIASAVVELERGRSGGVASRIKDYDKCPPSVATYIVHRLKL